MKVPAGRYSISNHFCPSDDSDTEGMYEFSTGSDGGYSWFSKVNGVFTKVDGGGTDVATMYLIPEPDGKIIITEDTEFTYDSEMGWRGGDHWMPLGCEYVKINGKDFPLYADIPCTEKLALEWMKVNKGPYEVDVDPQLAKYMRDIYWNSYSKLLEVLYNLSHN